MVGSKTPTKRQLRLLNHVARYGITASHVIADTEIVGGANEEATRKQLSRLCQAGYLNSEDLFDQRVYYHLTKRGAKAVGAEYENAKHFKPAPLVRAFAPLVFCCDARFNREKLTLEEFKKFPGLHQRGMVNNYYINDDADPPRIGFYKIDYSPKGGRWTRLITWIRDYTQKRCSQPAFQKLILDGQFELTILTALEKKAIRLHDALNEAPDIAQAQLNIDYYVIPDLLPLISPDPED